MGDEAGIDRTLPGEGPSQQREHCSAGADRKPSRGVEGTEHVWCCSTVLIEVEGEAATEDVEAMPMGVEADAVFLESVAEAGLGDAGPEFELAAEPMDVGMQIGVDGLDVVGDDGGEQHATVAGGRIDR